MSCPVLEDIEKGRVSARELAGGDRKKEKDSDSMEGDFIYETSQNTVTTATAYQTSVVIVLKTKQGREQ